VEHRLFAQPWPEGAYRFFQLGFVVRHLVAVAGRWAEVFGVGPFHVLPRREVAYTHRGAASALDLQVGVAQAGPVQIELIEQFCDRPSVFRDVVGDALDAGRPGASGAWGGLHQLCTVTTDYDATVAHYRALGYETIGELAERGQRVAYVDTFADFGFVTEVAQEAPGFLDQLAAIDRTCASWDGRDPVRLLTRDGYRVP
jgi:hypothetical protein